MQRLLRALRRKTAEQLVAEEPLGEATTAAPLPRVVDGYGYAGPIRPQPLSSSKPENLFGAADQLKSDRLMQWATRVTFADALIRGVKFWL